MENNVIDLPTYRTQLQHDKIAQSYYDMFQTLFGIYMQYFVYPVIAAVATANQKRIVKIRHN